MQASSDATRQFNKDAGISVAYGLTQEKKFSQSVSALKKLAKLWTNS